MTRSVVFLLLGLAWSSICAQQLQDVDRLQRVLTVTTSDSDRLSVLLALASNLEYPQPEAARANARNAVLMAERLKDPRRIAEAVELVGGASTVMGDTTHAIAILKKALDLRIALHDEVATAHCWWRLGYAYRKARRMDLAAEAFEKCISIGERLNASETCAEGLYALSDLRQDEGRYDEMLTLALRADSIYRPDPTTLTRARALGYLGNAYLSRGELDSAFAVLTRSRALCAVIHAEYWVAWNDLHLGYVYSDRGEHTNAGKQAQSALAAFERLGAIRDQPALNHFLAYTYWEVLSDSIVYPYFLRARFLADSLGMLRQRTTTDIAIGKFLIGADSTFLERIGIPYTARFDRASIPMKEGLATAERINDRPLMGFALNALAALENYRPDLRAAIGYHQRYLELQRAIGDKRYTTSALLGLGNDHLLLGDHQAAIRYLLEAKTVSEANGLDDLRSYVYRDLFEAYKRSGQPSQALGYLEQWKAHNDSLRNNGLTEQLTKQELTYTFQKEQLADSLNHVQALAMEKQVSHEAVARQRYLAFGAMALLLGGGIAITLDRKRRKERFAKRALQLEMQALRAQMNPHFLFNALASINGFIGRQDPEAAKAFVARFAKLTRMVLENSRHTEVPLAKDLEALQLYMELEQIRSGNTFDFRIEVAPEVETSHVRVPPLVIQPLVENAIWHGVANKSGRGTIIVHVGMRNDQLVLSVEDDGVGMSAGHRSAATGEEAKSSLGTTITRSRLALLAQQKGRAAEFTYLDRPVGTKVELALPV